MTPCPHAVLFLVLGDPVGTYWRCDRCTFRVSLTFTPAAMRPAARNA